MIGGTIVQVFGNSIEVLESQSCDRSWRSLDSTDDVRVGDEIWWQSNTGFLSRRAADGEPGFRDRNVGRCTWANAFGRKTQPDGSPVSHD